MGQPSSICCELEKSQLFVVLLFAFHLPGEGVVGEKEGYNKTDEEYARENSCGENCVEMFPSFSSLPLPGSLVVYADGTSWNHSGSWCV